MAQSPPQSARSGQCNARSKLANCRRNSSSVSRPAGGRSHQGAAGSAALPAVHPAPHAPWPAPSTAVPSSRRSRAPRAVSSAASRAHNALKSAHAGPRDAPSGRASYLRRGTRQCESFCVRVPRQVRPSRTPRPHHRILYPSVRRSPATMAPSMATPSADPARAPPSAWGKGSAPPPSASFLPPLSNHILVRRRFGAPIGLVARHAHPSGNLSSVHFTA